MPPYIDLTGERFGKLTVLGRVNPTGRPRLLCRCDCGCEAVVDKRNLTSGNTKSCGCHARETWAKPHTWSRIHGASTAPEYYVWRAMIVRCTKPTAPQYPSYGGRGITVTDRWTKFAAFYEDMGSRPTPKHTLDRIDNSGNYEPGNCRWATKIEQAANRRTTRWVESPEGRIPLAEASRRYGIPLGTLRRRFDRGRWPGDSPFSPVSSGGAHGYPSSEKS